MKYWILIAKSAPMNATTAKTIAISVESSRASIRLKKAMPSSDSVKPMM